MGIREVEVGHSSPPLLSMFKMEIPLCCFVLHEVVACNPANGNNVGGQVAIPVQHPLHCSCAETVLFA